MQKFLDWLKEVRRIHLVLGVIVLLTIPCYCIGLVVFWNDRLDRPGEDSPDELTPTVTLASDITATYTYPALTSTVTETATITPTFTSTITYVLPPTETPTPTSTFTASPTSTNTPIPSVTSVPPATNTPTNTLTPSATASDPPLPAEN